MLRAAPLKPELDERRIELCVPGSRSLPETMQRLDKMKHLVFMTPEHETGGLLDVDFLLQLAIEEGRFCVHVMDRPSLTGGVHEQQPD